MSSVSRRVLFGVCCLLAAVGAATANLGAGAATARSPAPRVGSLRPSTRSALQPIGAA